MTGSDEEGPVLADRVPMPHTDRPFRIGREDHGEDAMSVRPATSSAQSSDATRAEILRDVASVEAVAAAWNELLGRSALRTPFMTHEWAMAWLATVGRDVRPFVVLVREAGQLVLLAPFCLRPDGVLTLIGLPQSDYAGLLFDPERLDAFRGLARVLLERRADFRRIELDHLPEDRSAWRELSDELAAAGFPVRASDAGDCLYASLEDVESVRKQYYKKNIQNYVNWFAKRGDLRYTVYEDLDSSLLALDALFEQHVVRWAETPFPSAFGREDVREFYRHFVTAMYDRGWVEISSLQLDDEFLALYLYFDFDGVIYMYKPTFNLEYKSHSPGQVILRFVLDRALAQGKQVLDYGRGDEAYKNRFADRVRANKRVIVYGSHWERRAAELRQALRESRLVDGMLKNERIGGVLRRLAGIRG